MDFLVEKSINVAEKRSPRLWRFFTWKRKVTALP
jgi:hypothetical protein